MGAEPQARRYGPEDGCNVGVQSAHSSFRPGSAALSDSEREHDETLPVDRGTTAGGETDPEATVLRDSAPGLPGSPGRRVGRYTLMSELGHGGQGYVFLAEDRRLQRKVALKLLPAALSFAGHARLRFEREAEVASRLRHPGICTVYEVGEHEGVPFIAMELVEGEALDRLIRRAREAVSADAGEMRLIDLAHAASDAAAATTAATGTRTTQGDRNPVMAVVRFFEDAARALHVAHESGLVHRDIKPGNLMAADDGRAVILDFGLARDDASTDATLTQSGDQLGTPAYMSPEQVQGRSDIDRRTDVFSLGASLYECLTLVRAFQGTTRNEIYRAIVGEEPADPSVANPAISRDLRVVLQTALSKERERRYATALDFAEELRRLRHFEPIRARPAGPYLRLKRWAQRNPRVAALAALLLLSLLAGLVALTWKNRQLEEAGRETRRSYERVGAALKDYERLADVTRLEQAKAAAEALWPPHPDRVEALLQWKADYGPLADRLAQHQATLDDLRGRARPYSDEDRRRDWAADLGRIEAIESESERLRARLLRLRDEDRIADTEDRIDDLEDQRVELAARTEERRSWAFDDARIQWKHDVIMRLVADLERFADPDTGVPASIDKRLVLSRDLRRKTVDEHAEAWGRAAAEVAAAPAYEGLELAPQVGLIPLGADPVTGLQEFVHHLTHAGPLPARDARGRLVLEDGTGVVLVLLPGGSFLMGAQPDDPGGPNYDPRASRFESPVHEVTLRAFFVSKFEMTQSQWARWTGADGARAIRPGRNHDPARAGVRPAALMSWFEAERVLRQLGLSLPTEAQWEYAARAGTSTVWPFGVDRKQLDAFANLSDRYFHESGGPVDWPYDADLDDGYEVFAPVGTFRPNSFGLHDVIGNVWEWCLDFDAPYDRPARAGDGLRNGSMDLGRGRAHRGGGFLSPPFVARVAYRNPSTPDAREPSTGLRPARALD